MEIDEGKFQPKITNNPPLKFVYTTEKIVLRLCI